MFISSKDWKNYIERLSALDKKAGDLMREWIAKHGFTDTKAMTDYAFALAQKYGEGSAALSAEMYDAVAEMQGKLYPPAEAMPPPDYGEVAKTVNGILKHSQNPNSVANGVSRLVKRTGADTTLNNALRDGAEFAWVPNGDTCAFCITLASRGWQRMSKKALKNGHAEHIHANCDCTYSVRFDGKSGIEGYDSGKYLKVYEEAEGDTPNEKINSIRRMRYAQNKDVLKSPKKVAPKDVTDLYKENLSKNKAFVSEAIEYKAPNGYVYKVNGIDVAISYDNEEEITAILLSRALGEKVEFCPRVFGKNEGVETPDYLVGTSKYRWDRKGLGGAGKDAVRDAIKRHRGQAENFVVDISNWKGEKDSVINQVNKVFSSYNTAFVNSIIVTKDNEIIKALIRQ